MDFLLRKDGLVISGTCGDHECWHDTQAGTENLGETCTTAYLIRFWDELLRRTGDPVYGDLMERAIYNSLFAAQSPDGRKIRYYTPFEGPRQYYDADTYCCPCNYRRAIAELPAEVYYQTPEGLAVNLYTPSTVKAALPNGHKVELRQETDYPNSGNVALKVDPEQPAEFTLAFRIPRWAAGATIQVNGKDAGVAAHPGTLAKVHRQWSPGDQVAIAFPMEWRLVKGRRSQVGRAAIMRGPQVFSLRREGNEGFESIDLRRLTLRPGSVAGPAPDAHVRPGGMQATADMWDPAAWYPHAATRPVTLTEFADPDAEAAYFRIPNPNDPLLVDDELNGVEATL
jgi:DUF1680 family protein